METTLTLWKPVESRRAHRQGQKKLVLGIVLSRGVAGSLALLLMGCGGGNSTPVTPPIPAVEALQAVDVQNIVQAAVNSGNVDMAVAVVDRAGFVLGVFRTQNAPAAAVGNFGQVQDANDVAEAPADLYGIENTNRGCTLINDPTFQSKIPPALALGGGFGLGVLTGKADVMDSNPTAVNPGGVPIFYKNAVLGGIGVVTTSSNVNVAEYAAFVGSTAARSGPADRFGPSPAPPGVVFIGGIALPFVGQTARPAGLSAGPVVGTGSYVVAPTSSPGQPPDGDLITPGAGPMGGLSAADVKQILDNAEATANMTRAAIRLPLGSKARMVIAVADLDGTIIGLRRMQDSTIFSIDVAATKARNMVYFNGTIRTAADLT